MADKRSPIQSHLVLYRIDPELHVRRFYSIMIERDLFGTVRLVCNWGRVGAHGRELATEFATEDDAREALEALAHDKRQQGYQDL